MGRPSAVIKNECSLVSISGFPVLVMTSLDFRNTNTLWCSVLVETLVRLGVRRAVISPGSRSAPLTFAFALAICTPLGVCQTARAQGDGDNAQLRTCVAALSQNRIRREQNTLMFWNLEELRKAKKEDC